MQTKRTSCEAEVNLLVYLILNCCDLNDCLNSYVSVEKTNSLNVDDALITTRSDLQCFFMQNKNILNIENKDRGYSEDKVDAQLIAALLQTAQEKYNENSQDFITVFGMECIGTNIFFLKLTCTRQYLESLKKGLPVLKLKVQKLGQSIDTKQKLCGYSLIEINDRLKIYKILKILSQMNTNNTAAYTTRNKPNDSMCVTNEATDEYDDEAISQNVLAHNHPKEDQAPLSNVKLADFI